MNPAVDLLSCCRPGDLLRTRDRREALIVSVSLSEGLIAGEVQMHGPCVWGRDGRWRESPFGAAGPLDLVLPSPEAAAKPRSASVKEALAEGNRHYCCD